MDPGLNPDVAIQESFTKVMRGASVFFFICSLFFLSSNITGNAILGIPKVNSNIIGVIFFICGLALFKFSK